MKRIYKDKVLIKQKASVARAGVEKFTYKGFNSNNNKKNFKSYDIELVKQDILNHFHIKKGEKLENPQFGTIIWNVIFEPFTQQVKEAIANNVEEIINYDPRVAINAITVDSTDIGIRIEANITYLQFDVSEKMILNFDRNNNVIS